MHRWRMPVEYWGIILASYGPLGLLQWRTPWVVTFRGLVGNVADMLAICRSDSQMSAHLADMPLLWRLKIDPDTTLLCG